MIKSKISLLRNNYFSVFSLRAHHLFFKWTLELCAGYKMCHLKNNVLNRIWKVFSKYWQILPSVKYVLIFCLWVIFIVLKTKKTCVPECRLLLLLKEESLQVWGDDSGIKHLLYKHEFIWFPEHIESQTQWCTSVTTSATSALLQREGRRPLLVDATVNEQ